MPESATSVAQAPPPAADLVAEERHFRHELGSWSLAATAGQRASDRLAQHHPAGSGDMASLKVRPVTHQHEGRGTLLAVVPVNGGSARLAIVGYFLPLTGQDSIVPPDELPEDGMVVDAAQHRVVLSGRDAGLLFREFELLAFLAANPGRAFTRAHLLASVWGDAYQGTTRTVDVHIHRLRRKLGPEYAQRLVTVQGVGYLYQPSGAETLPAKRRFSEAEEHHE
jgi:DNA-binding winged helix-turn-helix (wHTH) protein